MMKDIYDAAVKNLSDLLDKRDALRRDELVKAIINSGRSYEELTNSEKIDAKTAGAILLALVRGIDRDSRNYDNSERTSEWIRKECCLNKRMADRLAEIFLELYSEEKFLISCPDFYFLTQQINHVPGTVYH